MRTEFFSPETMPRPDLPEVYQGTITDHVLQGIASLDGTAAQDPKKTGEVIVREVLEGGKGHGEVLGWMPLGKEALGQLKARIGEYENVARRVEKVAESCDFD
jgi:hypothetical protein